MDAHKDGGRSKERLLRLQSDEGCQAETAFHEVIESIDEHVADILEMLADESLCHLHDSLAELLGYAQTPKALPLFEKMLYGDNEGLSHWAVDGLVRLGTDDAMRLIEAAEKHEFADSKRTEFLRSRILEAKRTILGSSEY